MMEPYQKSIGANQKELPMVKAGLFEAQNKS